MKHMKEKKSTVIIQCAFRIYLSNAYIRRKKASIENWRLLELHRRAKEEQLQMATIALISVIVHQRVKERFYLWLEYINSVRVKERKASKERARLKASTLIQSVYRMYASKAQIKRVKEAIIDWTQHLRCPPLCIHSQPHVQGELMMRCYTKAVEKEETRLHQASCTIQKIFRGFRTRIRLKNARCKNFSYVDLELEKILSLDVDCILDDILAINNEPPASQWQPQRPSSSCLHQYRDDGMDFTIDRHSALSELDVYKKKKEEIDRTSIPIGECGGDDILHETRANVDSDDTITRTSDGGRHQLKAEWKLKDERVLEVSSFVGLFSLLLNSLPLIKHHLCSVYVKTKSKNDSRKTKER